MGRKSKSKQALESLLEKEPQVDIEIKKGGGTDVWIAKGTTSFERDKHDSRMYNLVAELRGVKTHSERVGEKDLGVKRENQLGCTGSIADLSIELGIDIKEWDEYREGMRERVELHLNSFVHTQYPKTATQKKQLVDLINKILDHFDLAIEYRGYRCRLYSTSGQNDNDGRFKLTPLGTSRTVASPPQITQLLPLVLVHKSPPICTKLPIQPDESRVDWQSKIKNDANHDNLTQDKQRD